MFGKHLFCGDNFVAYLKTRHAHQALLTWKAVVQVPEENVVAFLEDIYDRNLPLAKQNIERKKIQSNLAKKKEKQMRTARPESPRKRKPHHCQVLPPSLAQILMLHPEHLQSRNPLDIRLHPARGNPTLEDDPHGVSIVTTMVRSRSGPNTEGSGGTEMGPAAAGFSGASSFLFPNAVVEYKSDVAW